MQKDGFVFTLFCEIYDIYCMKCFVGKLESFLCITLYKESMILGDGSP